MVCEGCAYVSVCASVVIHDNTLLHLLSFSLTANTENVGTKNEYDVKFVAAAQLNG